MVLEKIRTHLAPLALNLTVFVCGAIVMIYEIIGSRIVAPYIGTSTYVWTSLIGVILGSLSLGYWLGGKLADRRPDIRILATAVFIAGGLVSVTILIKDVFTSFVGGSGWPIELKAVVAAIVLFAPASICLGCVTPFAARLKLAAVAETGRTVGSLYALSTLGSILGTFAAGFFLIPFVGSVRTLYIIAGTLLVVALILAPLQITRTNIATAILFIFAIISSEIGHFMLARTSGLIDVDTEYSRVRIINTVDSISKRPVRALATDPYITQSAVFTDSDELVLSHNRFYHLLRHFKPDFRAALMLGGAGYTYPRDYLRSYPHASIDVVEIDPQMTELAKQHFRLIDDERLTIIHEDARTFLNDAQPKAYDAVLIDVFGSLFSIPTHLTTREAVNEIRRVLKPGGVAILNLGSAVTGPASLFLQAEFVTYQSAFPTVLLFKVHPEYANERLQNLIIVAVDRDFSSISLESPDPEIAGLLSRLQPAPQSGGIKVLTDDLAPVERYNSIALNEYLRQPR